MIFRFDQENGNNLIDSAIDEDKENINDTGSEFKFKRNVLAVLIDIILGPHFHCNLSADDRHDKE